MAQTAEEMMEDERAQEAFARREKEIYVEHFQPADRKEFFGHFTLGFRGLRIYRCRVLYTPRGRLDFRLPSIEPYQVQFEVSEADRAEIVSKISKAAGFPNFGFGEGDEPPY